MISLNQHSIQESQNDLSLSKETVVLGYARECDLPGLYTASDVFVYPSIHEGFGLPPLRQWRAGRL
jgi:glycosyltransferase involved in cell wall biosynthesis